MTTKPAKPRKTTKPLTEAQLRQRREAAKKSTGPRTLEGKARSSRNNWKTGLHSKANLTSAIHRGHFDTGLDALVGAVGKPCKSTCPKYPCSLVDDGVTSPGGSCLDKTVYVQAFAAVIDAVQNRSMEGVGGVMAAEIASTLQMLHDLREQCADMGPILGIPAVTSEGNVITRADGSEVMSKWIVNPAWPVVLKTLEVLGISLPEALATPQAQARAKVEGEAADALQQAMGGIFQRAQAARALPDKRRVIDAEVVK